MRRGSCKTAGLLLWGVLSLAAVPAQAQTVGSDKALHFGVSALMAGVVTSATEGNELRGFWVASAVGVAKELSDANRRGHTASGGDMAANLLGAYVGAKLGGFFVKPERGGFSVGLRGEF